jgi:hypothetical protein
VQVEVLGVARPLARPELGGIVRLPRGRWTDRIAERVDPGSRVAPRVHVDVD